MLKPRPLYSLPDITHISPQVLLDAHGITAVILDLDNTLMLPKAGILPESITQWLDQAKAVGLDLLCVTNNKDREYCHAVEGVLGFPVIYFAAKPHGYGLKLALRMLERSPKSIVVVGDRPTSDIWGGAWLGCHTILTRPLRHDEPPLYHILRGMEHWFVGRPLHPVPIATGA